MLNKLNLAVRKMAERDRTEHRYATKAILISEDATEATNGSILVRVSRPAPGEAVGLLDAKDAEAFEKVLGTSRNLRNEPRSIEVARSSDSEITLSTPGDYLGDKGRSVTFSQPPGTWPQTERTIAATRERKTKAQVTLSVKSLKALVDLLTTADASGVRIRLTGSTQDDPCEFHARSWETGQHIYAMVAPMITDQADFDASIPPPRKAVVEEAKEAETA